MKKIYSILTILCAAFVAVSCTVDNEDIENAGYINLEMNTLVSTHTRADAPDGYNARKLHVTIDNGSTTVMESDYTETEGFANANMKGNVMLAPGTYTVTAHSANWDGNGTGFDAPYYYAQTSVEVESKKAKKVRLTLTQANVKVTVTWDQSFYDFFEEAECKVTSDAAKLSPRTFYMGLEQAPAYFPVDKLTLKVSVTNKSGEEFVQSTTIDDVNARDHFIINYKVADAGKEGEVTVSVDDATNTYTYQIAVPVAPSIRLVANEANSWSNFAYLSGEVSVAEYEADNMKLQWKKVGDEAWTEVAGANIPLDSKDAFAYKLTGLTPNTDYVYRVVYNDAGEDVVSDEKAFTTESQPVLYNGGFENWYSVSNYYSPNESGVEFWDTSNPGSASFNYVVTTPETSFVHSGTRAAKLASQYAVIKLAAGSIYTGKFGKVSGTSATLDWGSPFTGRPTALRAWICYSPGSINRGSKPSVSGAPNSGTNDYCNVRIALMTKSVTCNNNSSSFYFPKFDGTDDFVIAHGLHMQNTSDNGQWKEVIIPLTYYDITKKPTHILVAAASSAYGDYFYGSDSSVLYVDDFELIYGDDPIIQQ